MSYTEFMNDAMRSWLPLVLAAGLFYLVGQYVASSPQRMEQEAAVQREISVQGQGEVSSRPDVARLTLGVQTGPQATAAHAIDRLGQRFAAVETAVRQQGIDRDDIKTAHFSLQPAYDFQDGRQTLRGYEASESISITIRNFEAVSTVIAEATRAGANHVGGVTFEIDDPQVLQAQAEAHAIAEARAKAEALAQELGVRLGKVKTFNAAGVTPPVPYFARGELTATDAASTELKAPPVPPGTQDITANVTITYTIE